jgi:hypothetical protein
MTNTVSASARSSVHHHSGKKPCGINRENKSILHGRTGLTLARMTRAAVSNRKPISVLSARAAATARARSRGRGVCDSAKTTTPDVVVRARRATSPFPSPGQPGEGGTRVRENKDQDGGERGKVRRRFGQRSPWSGRRTSRTPLWLGREMTFSSSIRSIRRAARL